jgi:hypothetical protein
MIAICDLLHLLSLWKMLLHHVWQTGVRVRHCLPWMIVMLGLRFLLKTGLAVLHRHCKNASLTLRHLGQMIAPAVSLV